VQGAAALADMLKITPYLQSLSLEWNQIGSYEMAMASLAGALEVNESLTHLGEGQRRRRRRRRSQVVLVVGC